MAKKLVPLTLDKIEEGNFIEEINEEMVRVYKSLVAHQRKYGPDATAKSTAELTIKIKFKPHSARDASFSVVGSMSAKIPGRPSSHTLAIHEQEQTGEHLLFVPVSGSHGDSPRQMKFATEDGRGINQATGEVVEPPATAKKKPSKGED